MTNYKFLQLKAELLGEGIQATPDALHEVGVEYKEQNHGLFGFLCLVLPPQFFKTPHPLSPSS